MTPLRPQALRGYWDGLAPRDRKALLLALLVCGGALFWLLGLEPALEGRKRLQQQLPALQEQAASMRAMAEEVRQLRASQGAVAGVEASEASVKASLERLRVKAVVVSAGEGRMKVTGQAQPAVAVLTWIGSIHRELRLAPVTVSLRKTAPGVMDFELMLEAAAAGGR